MKDHFLLAFSNLRRRKLRSWLTMIGIFIGIAAVVGLISLGQGLQNAITSEFEELGKDKIIIQSKTTMSMGAGSSSSLILTTEDLETIEEVRGVDNAIGILLRTIIIGYHDESEAGVAIGINAEDVSIFSELQSFKLGEGRLLKEGDEFKVVVGYSNSIDGKIWEKGIEVGSTITIEEKEFKVVGILEKTGDPTSDSAIYLSRDALREVLKIGNQEDEIVAGVEDGFTPSEVAEAITEKLRRARGEEENQETFTVQTSEQLLDTFNNIFNVVQGVLIGIAAISLLVGGIGIMNTMYTSVLERTKEIGTMKAIGAKNSDILQIFLFESGLLGLVGGTIGVGLGILLGKGVEYVAGILLDSNLLQASITLPLIVGALTFSFLIGSLSGILPAFQAAKLKPADALRYE